MDNRNLTKRIFPDLTENFYATEYEETADTDEIQARRFLALRNEKLNLWRRNLSFNFDKTDKLKWLVTFHAEAVENELKGETTKADYFWRQFLLEMTDVKNESKYWNKYLAKYETTSENNSARIWNYLPLKFIGEVVIPFQLGFYAGYVTETDHETAADRAELHLRYFAELYSLCTYDETVEIIFPQVKAVCFYLADCGKTFAALDLCLTLRANLSVFYDWQTLFLTLKREAVLLLGNIWQNTSENGQMISNVLWNEQDNLRDDWRLFKNNLAYFNVRADLAYLRALIRANDGDITSALRSTEIALAFQPLHFQANELRGNLSSQIEEIINQLKETEDQQHLLEMFMQQANEALEYRYSDEFSNTEAARHTAVALTIWREIGLEKKKGFAGKAAALTDSINSIFADPPESEERLKAVWFEHTAPSLDFSDDEREKIFQYLRKILFDTTEPEIEPEISAPVFVPAAPAETLQEVGWNYWLFGPEDRNLKIRTVVSCAVVLVIGFFVVHSFTTSYLRNRAYSQLRESVRLHDYHRAVKSAENFLAYDSFWGADEREKRVIAFYDEAVVRLVLEQPDEQLSPEINDLIARHAKSTEKLRPPKKDSGSLNINTNSNSPRQMTTADISR